MNKHFQNAAQRLHKFAAECAECTETELRADLQAQGVNVEAFLARLDQEGAIKPSTADAKKPTASERLRALAGRAGGGVKKLLNEFGATAEAGTPTIAYGRSGGGGKGRRPANAKKRRGNRKRRD